LDQIANEIYPMADLPDEWKTGDNGEPALNWVAAIHRSTERRDPVLGCNLQQ